MIFNTITAHYLSSTIYRAGTCLAKRSKLNVFLGVLDRQVAHLADHVRLGLGLLRLLLGDLVLLLLPDLLSEDLGRLALQNPFARLGESRFPLLSIFFAAKLDGQRLWFWLLVGIVRLNFPDPGFFRPTVRLELHPGPNEMIGADLQRFVPSHENSRSLVFEMFEDFGVASTSLLPLRRLAFVGIAVQLGTKFYHFLLLLLPRVHDHLWQRDDGREVGVVCRGVILVILVVSLLVTFITVHSRVIFFFGVTHVMRGFYFCVGFYLLKCNFKQYSL